MGVSYHQFVIWGMRTDIRQDYSAMELSLVLFRSELVKKQLSALLVQLACRTSSLLLFSDSKFANTSWHARLTYLNKLFRILVSWIILKTHATGNVRVSHIRARLRWEWLLAGLLRQLTRNRKRSSSVCFSFKTHVSWSRKESSHDSSSLPESLFHLNCRSAA